MVPYDFVKSLSSVQSGVSSYLWHNFSNNRGYGTAKPKQCGSGRIGKRREASEQSSRHMFLPWFRHTRPEAWSPLPPHPAEAAGTQLPSLHSADEISLKKYLNYRTVCSYQCCGSGSAGSIVFGPSGSGSRSGSFYNHAKIVIKT